MTMRKIISGVLVLVLMLCVLSVSSFTLAQDVPLATVEATVNGQPVEATLIPVTTPAPVDNGVSVTHEVFQGLITLALIIGLIALAFRTAGLVPKETFDSAIDKGFGVLGALAGRTDTPFDDKLVEFAKPTLKAWLDAELAKRDAATINVTVQNPEVSTGADGKLLDAVRRAIVTGQP